MKFRELSQEFRRELFKAIRLSVFLTTLVLGFLIFQNRTAIQEEISPLAQKCTVDRTGNRVPASADTAVRDRVDCTN